ncbi:MAG: hypothetical protein QM681_14610 [Novosphingobium sp.]
MIEAIKAPIRRHWTRLRLRTILLLTFVFIAALPGVGALFLRVYENSLVRQTEAELVAQGAALAATASADWPGSSGPSIPPHERDGDDIAGGALSTIDLRTSRVLPERPPPAGASGEPTPNGAGGGEPYRADPRCNRADHARFDRAARCRGPGAGWSRWRW